MSPLSKLAVQSGVTHTYWESSKTLTDNFLVSNICNNKCTNVIFTNPSYTHSLHTCTVFTPKRRHFVWLVYCDLLLGFITESMWVLDFQAGSALAPFSMFLDFLGYFFFCFSLQKVTSRVWPSEKSPWQEGSVPIAFAPWNAPSVAAECTRRWAYCRGQTTAAT